MDIPPPLQVVSSRRIEVLVVGFEEAIVNAVGFGGWFGIGAEGDEGGYGEEKGVIPSCVLMSNIIYYLLRLWKGGRNGEGKQGDSASESVRDSCEDTPYSRILASAEMAGNLACDR